MPSKSCCSFKCLCKKTWKSHTYFLKRCHSAHILFYKYANLFRICFILSGNAKVFLVQTCLRSNQGLRCNKMSWNSFTLLLLQLLLWNTLWVCTRVAPADPSAAKSVHVCVSLIYQCVNEFAVVLTQKMSAESVCRHSCTLSCKNVIVCRPDCLQGLRLLNGCRPRCILGVFTPVVKSTCDQT